MPLVYAMGRAAETAAPLDRLSYPLRFALAQLADHGGLILLLILARGWRRPAAAETIPVSVSDSAFERRYVLALALGPLLTALLVSALFGIKFRAMWGAPMFAFSGLLAVVWLGGFVRRRRLGPTAALWLALFAAGLVFVGVAKLAGPHWKGEPSRHLYPGRASAAFFTQAWREQTGTPLTIVVGDGWTGGNLGFYSADRPSLFIEADSRRGFWITDEALRRHGALLIWPAKRYGPEPPPAFTRPFSEMAAKIEVQPVKTFAWQSAAALPPLRLGWAIVRPE